MAINTSPPPAVCTTVVDPAGRGTVVRVVYAHHEDGETLAFKLAHAYQFRTEHSEELPEELPLADLMELLGAQGAACAEGWHVPANEPTEESWNLVWPWAQDQIRRIFPDVSWTVEPDRRIVMPWDGEAGTSPGAGK
ncbi:hypothetical protein ABT072_47650 [Streptomyces sp. NPDC002589]|uniref:hypothetical protein n=1 Tax=Streptomyces sp. NPDC002589 TaxID=3154420 RepID=UPI00331AD0A9